MKIFLDTSNIDEITKWAKTGILDGITTNPTNLQREGSTKPVKIIKDILNILPGKSISVEVTEMEPEKIYKQAQEISKISEDVVVKIPCHTKYYEVIKKLISQGIKINVTLVFNLLQAVAVAKLGVTYVSPFVGRIDDIGQDGMELVKNIVSVFGYHMFETEVLAASIRSAEKMTQAALAGADIITVSEKVLDKALSDKLTDAGMKKFIDDWKKLNIKKFP